MQSRVRMDATCVCAGGAHVSADAAYIRTDGVLPRTDVVKTRPRVNYVQAVKTGRRRRPNDENGRTDDLNVRTVIFT
jgi:hypothetical protein